MDFFTWFSIVSLIINVILIVYSYGLYVASKKEKESRNAQVKIWMQYANGITHGLQRITANFLENLWTKKEDITGAVHSLEAVSFSLYQSLYEERVISEEEYKEEQKKIRDNNQGGGVSATAPSSNTNDSSTTE
jgi:hypothetical protein